MIRPLLLAAGLLCVASPAALAETTFDLEWNAQREGYQLVMRDDGRTGSGNSPIFVGLACDRLALGVGIQFTSRPRVAGERATVSGTIGQGNVAESWHWRNGVALTSWKETLFLADLAKSGDWIVIWIGNVRGVLYTGFSRLQVLEDFLRKCLALTQ